MNYNYNEPTTKVEVQQAIPVKNTESTQPPVNNTSFWSWFKIPDIFKTDTTSAPALAPAPKTGGKRKSRLTKKNKKSKSVKSRK